MERRIKSILLLAMLVMALSGHIILPGTNIDDCDPVNSPQKPNGGSSQLPNPNGNQNNGIPQTPGFGFPQIPSSNPNLNQNQNSGFPQFPGFGSSQRPSAGFPQFPSPNGNQNTGFPGFGFPQFSGSNPIGNSNPNGPQLPGSQFPGFRLPSGSNPSFNPSFPQFPGFGFPGFPSNNGNNQNPPTNPLPNNNGNTNQNNNENPNNNGSPNNNGNLPPGSLVIDSQSKSCTEKQIQLEGGQTQITFDYFTNSNTATKSILVVRFDGETVQTIKPSQTGSKVKLLGYIAKGLHSLSFCPQGDSSEPNFKHGIANFVINNVPQTRSPTPPQNCKPTYGDNIIVNGDFELNGCKGVSRCGYNISNYQPSILPGWRPNPEIEVALGYVQNCEAFPYTQNYVTELDALTRNTCISQKVRVDNGKIQLKFNYAARAGVLKAGAGLSLQTCRFVIKIGGQVIKEITPPDERLHREVYELDLGRKGTMDLEFCGAGTSDGYGANIDNIEFANAEACA